MSSVMVSLRVAATPQRAFAVFVEEIGAWWQSNPLFVTSPRGPGRLCFEAHLGGRLLEQAADGDQYELGRITAFEPGRHLGFTWCPPSLAPDKATRVEVAFEQVGPETRVSVTHHGWDRVPQAHALRHGFPLSATQARLAEWWQSLLLRYKARDVRSP